MHPPPRFWAITSYFNPAGYARRLANYRIFRQRLTVPLVTVEWSPDGRFDLRPGDADILVQLRCEDVLWQKERLLNIALERLPRDARTVAWLDCDLIFEDAGWAERADALLDAAAIVVPYATLYELPKDGLPEDASAKATPGCSLPYALKSGVAQPEVLRTTMRLLERISSGGAGVARRHLLDRHGFYDACVVGSGDRAAACAALGRFDDAIHYLRMNPGWAAHYLAWAKPYFETVQGRIACLEGGIFHLWHGDLANRQYAERHRFLAASGFDPAAHIFIDEQGCWRWRQMANGAREQVLRYFHSRREDG